MSVDTAPKVGPAPTVTELAGQLVVQWPLGHADEFLIRTSLFEAMVVDINAGKRMAAVLERIKASIEELT